MNPEQIVEATLFASQTPLTARELARADEALDLARVREALGSLREHYEAYSKESGIEPLAPNQFGAALRERGFVRERKRDGIRWLGLKRRPPEEM